jgi:endonuclease YncB( thermonuclease family)
VVRVGDGDGFQFFHEPLLRRWAVVVARPLRMLRRRYRDDVARKASTDGTDGSGGVFYKDMSSDRTLPIRLAGVDAPECGASSIGVPCRVRPSNLTQSPPSSCSPLWRAGASVWCRGAHVAARFFADGAARREL